MSIDMLNYVVIHTFKLKWWKMPKERKVKANNHLHEIWHFFKRIINGCLRLNILFNYIFHSSNNNNLTKMAELIVFFTAISLIWLNWLVLTFIQKKKMLTIRLKLQFFLCNIPKNFSPEIYGSSISKRLFPLPSIEQFFLSKPKDGN